MSHSETDKQRNESLEAELKSLKETLKDQQQKQSEIQLRHSENEKQRNVVLETELKYLQEALKDQQEKYSEMQTKFSEMQMRNSSESKFNLLSTERTSEEKQLTSRTPETDRDRADDILSRMRIPNVEDDRLFDTVSSGRLSEDRLLTAHTPMKRREITGVPRLVQSETKRMQHVESEKLLPTVSPRGIYTSERLGSSQTPSKERNSAGLETRLSHAESERLLPNV